MSTAKSTPRKRAPIPRGDIAPPDTCYLRHCPGLVAPGRNPARLCAAHIQAARGTWQVMVEGIATGGCLAGCKGHCERGKFKSAGSGGFREFARGAECEFLPAHMLAAARGETLFNRIPVEEV